jgi:hypothetical protein
MLRSRVVMMAVLVCVAMMVVMHTTFRRLREAAFQAGGHKSFHRRVGLPGAHLDAMLGKKGESTLADATDDHHFDPQLTEPARERPRLVLGCGQRLSAQGGFGVRVHLNDRKLAAAAEMRVKPAVLNGNSNFHNVVVCL